MGLFLAFASGFDVRAQEPAIPSPAALTLPLRLVDGHVLLSATVYDRGGADDAISLELVLDSPGSITLHGDQLDWLKLDGSALRKNQHPPVKVVFGGGVTLSLAAQDFKAEGSSERIDRHNRLTRLFPTQLDERKVKGTIGLGFLKNYHVTLDLVGRQLTLAPLAPDPTAETAEPGAPNAEGADYSGTFELREGRLTLPIEVPGARPAGRLVLGSSSFDTLIDQDLAQALERPTGDVEPVTLLGSTALDLSRFVAFRPKAWRGTPVAETDDRVLLTGVNLLEAFRVEIDWTTSQLHLTQQADPAKPEADRAYFLAEATGTAEAFEQFLKAFPEARTSSEAAQKLMALRLDDYAPTDEELLAALDWVIKTSLPERRTETGLTYVNRFAVLPGRTALAIQAGHLALSHSRLAMTVQDVYRLHRVLGELYLEQGELEAAWKHLLSAAFVPIARDPDHAFRVALNLARVYEKQGRAARAYSRYKAALAVPGAPVTPALRQEIQDALARLKAGIPDDTLKMLDS